MKSGIMVNVIFMYKKDNYILLKRQNLIILFKTSTFQEAYRHPGLLEDYQYSQVLDTASFSEPYLIQEKSFGFFLPKSI